VKMEALQSVVRNTWIFKHELAWTVRGSGSYSEALDFISLRPHVPPGISREDPSSYSTFFHEMTHSYIAHADAHHKEFSHIVGVEFRQAIEYYRGSQMKNGGRASYPRQIAHEAAAEYVGQTVQAFVGANPSLERALNSDSRSGAVGLVLQAMNLYQNKPNERSSLGYETTYTLNTRDTAKTIHPGLNGALDKYFFGGSVPDDFRDVPRLKHLLSKIKDRFPNIDVNKLQKRAEESRAKSKIRTNQNGEH
jgi:hypothetical protein